MPESDVAYKIRLQYSQQYPKAKTFSFTFRLYERTLTSNEYEKVFNKIFVVEFITNNQRKYYLVRFLPGGWLRNDSASVREKCFCIPFKCEGKRSNEFDFCSQGSSIPTAYQCTNYSNCIHRLTKYHLQVPATFPKFWGKATTKVALHEPPIKQVLIPFRRSKIISKVVLFKS